METTTKLAIAIAVLVAAVLLLLFAFFSTVSKKNALRRDNEEYQELLDQRAAPHKIGSKHTAENGKEYIFVSFDAILTPLKAGGQPVTFFEIMDKFYRNPAATLNSFYNPENGFGLDLPVYGPTVLPNSNKFSIIVEDLNKNRYSLYMKEIPDTMTFELPMQKSKL